MELILVRHAQAESRVTLDGTPADPGLTALGHDQAMAVARWLSRGPVDRIVSSPARRAQETARPLAAAAGLGIDIDARLAEIDAKADEYRSIEEERNLDRAAYRERVAAYARDPRLAALDERVEAGLSEWVAQCPGGRLVVFTHGGAINVWTRRVLGLSPGMLFVADNGSCHRFMISREGVRSLASLNETAYLGTELLTH